MTQSRLTELIAGMQGKRIAVVGDLMLDRYIWGSVSRISPEAPVPIIDLETEQSRLGGAANVAKNIKSLGGEPLLVGVVGADNSGKQFEEIVQESGFASTGIIVDPSRPTTVKTRVIAHNQHVVRIDREKKFNISPSVQQRILDVLRQQIDAIDGIILEDYNKGVIGLELIREVIALANIHKKVITVDPKFNNFFEYKNVTVFKPNRKETEEVLGSRLSTMDEVRMAGEEIARRLTCRNVLLTLGEGGMVLFDDSGTMTHVPTKARNVQDVSGAGDTVISTLTMALVAGATIKEATTLSNFAGGIVCGYVGIVPIDLEELRKFVIDANNHLSSTHGRI